MNDTTSAAPSDAELTACYKEANGEMHGKAQPITTRRIFRAMRAAIVKWGAPQPVAGEPDAYLHDDGYWTAAKTDAGRNLNDRLLFAGSPKVAVYTTPQPTQAQAGAVPLNHRNIEPVRRFLADRGIYLSDETTKALIVAAHGIGTEKGGSHG